MPTRFRVNEHFCRLPFFRSFLRFSSDISPQSPAQYISSFSPSNCISLLCSFWCIDNAQTQNTTTPNVFPRTVSEGFAETCQMECKICCLRAITVGGMCLIAPYSFVNKCIHHSIKSISMFR